MEELKVITMEDMEELEDMVCLGEGGSMSCCNGGSGGSSSVSGSYGG